MEAGLQARRLARDKGNPPRRIDCEQRPMTPLSAPAAQHSSNLPVREDCLADVNSGHNVLASVFVQCRSMYRRDGPEELRPLGETEFANGVAAMSASGSYGPARICAGIVGHADLRLGARVHDVLEAHVRAGGGR